MTEVPKIQLSQCVKVPKYFRYTLVGFKLIPAQVCTANFLLVMNGHAQGKDNYFALEQKVIFLIFTVLLFEMKWNKSRKGHRSTPLVL